MSESTGERPPSEQALHVATNCLCLKAQRAGRTLARRFDTAFRPFGLTNGQFSLMLALHSPEPPTIGRLADFLAMDRTSLTAALKPLERRSLVTVSPGAQDRRARHVATTPQGVALLAAALPVWRTVHAELDRTLGQAAATRLRTDLETLSATRGPAERAGNAATRDKS